MKYQEMDRSGLLEEQAQCRKEYEALKAQGLKLDMSRESRGESSWIWSARF